MVLKLETYFITEFVLVTKGTRAKIFFQSKLSVPLIYFVNLEKMYMKITQMTDLNNGIIDMHMAYGKLLSNYFTSNKCSHYLQMIVKIKFDASEAPCKGA